MVLSNLQGRNWEDIIQIQNQLFIKQQWRERKWGHIKSRSTNSTQESKHPKKIQWINSSQLQFRPSKPNNKPVEDSKNRDWDDSLHNMSPFYSTSSRYRDTRRGRASLGSLKYHTNSSKPKLQERLDQIASGLPSPPNQQYFDLIPTLNIETSKSILGNFCCWVINGAVPYFVSCVFFFF